MTAQCRQLILTGLPGSGKSTVGAELARRVGWDFVDLDHVISVHAGRTIESIFAERGEQWFRELEAEATSDLRHRDGLITAPGGGWITRPETVALLRPPARLAYLRVSPRVAMERIRRSGVVRPLLGTDDPEAQIRALYESRAVLYEAADLTVDTEIIVNEVVTRLERWLVSEGLVP